MAEGPETSSSDQFSSQDSLKDQSQVPIFDGLKSPNGNIPMCPIMYPALIPGLFPPQMDQEQMNRGPGLYAVPVLPFMQPIAGFPTNTLIPFTYNIPTAHSSSGTREVGSEHGQPGDQPQQQQQEAGPQRQVIVRRFQIAIQLDLLLILKLAAAIFLFNQDGSKQRLTLLVFFASLVYLHQTGALAPVIRWLSQRTRRAAVRADNLPVAEAQGNENGGLAGAQPVGVNDGNTANENEHDGERGQGGGGAGNRWWGIVKEIQIIVFGFITSLLPGFNNLD